jgi:hypothetical protein
MRPTRRNILTGSAALAMGAVLPATAIAAAKDDTRLLAAVARARSLIDEHMRLCPAKERAWNAVHNDPECPILSSPHWGEEEAELLRRFPPHIVRRIERERRDRVNDRHGYTQAYEAWSGAYTAAYYAVHRVLAMRPRTIQGVNAKSALLGLALAQEDMIEAEEVMEANRADLLRLMGAA